MIQYEAHPEDGYVEFTLDGKIDRKSFEEVVSRLGPLMDEQGKIGILKRILYFGGISPSVLWDDLKFGFRHLKHVGPVAVVSDKKWIEVWTQLAAPFWASDVRFFELDEIDEARAWLAERMSVVRAESASS